MQGNPAEICKLPHVNYTLENKLNILDRIVVSNTDPSMSLAERQSTEEAMEGKETNFTIVTRDSDGLQCYQENDDIRVHISTPAGNQLKTDIKDTKDGKYTVTYTPQSVGQHRVVDIKCTFKHILKFLTTPTHEKSPKILNFPVKIKQNPKFSPKF